MFLVMCNQEDGFEIVIVAYDAASVAEADADIRNVNARAAGDSAKYEYFVQRMDVQTNLETTLDKGAELTDEERERVDGYDKLRA